MTLVASPCQSNASPGFTLLEVLVVIMLITLVMTLLIQGLSFIFDIRQKVRDNLLSAKPIILQEQFLRTVLSAMTADSIKGDSRFDGSPEKITGLTLAPLLSPQGVPSVVELSIEQQDTTCTLRYREPPFPPITLGQWEGSRCRFTYLTDKGKLSPEWRIAKDRLVQIPDGIFFQVEHNDGSIPFTLFTAIQGRRLARFYRTEFFDSEGI